LIAWLPGAPAAGAQSGRAVDVWLDLSEPVPAEADTSPQAAAQRQRVDRQQEEVALAVRRLGASELARVRHARNAIAVRIADDRLDALRRIDGVRRVRPTESLHPPELLRQGSGKNEPR
jgi:hypothetical protein